MFTVSVITVCERNRGGSRWKRIRCIIWTRTVIETIPFPVFRFDDEPFCFWLSSYLQQFLRMQEAAMSVIRVQTDSNRNTLFQTTHLAATSATDLANGMVKAPVDTLQIVVTAVDHTLIAIIDSNNCLSCFETKNSWLRLWSLLVLFRLTTFMAEDTPMNLKNKMSEQNPPNKKNTLNRDVWY